MEAAEKERLLQQSLQSPYMFSNNAPTYQIDYLGLCPADTCDSWTIDILGSMGGGDVAAAGSVYTKLRANGSHCNMCVREKYYNFNGGGVGAGFKAGASISFPPGLPGYDFQTPCISWDGHVGFGQYSALSGGMFVTITFFRLSTPQTAITGVSYGAGADLFIGHLAGYWRIKE